MALTSTEETSLRAGLQRKRKWNAILTAGCLFISITAGQVVGDVHGGHTPLDIAVSIGFCFVLAAVAALVLYRIQRNQFANLPLAGGADRAQRQQIRRALQAGHTDDRQIDALVRELRDYQVPRSSQTAWLATPIIVVGAVAAALPIPLELRVGSALIALVIAAIWASSAHRVRLLRRYRDSV